MTILALASRAFAFYYMLQCLVASSLAKSALQRCFFYLLADVLVLITLFAVPEATGCLKGSRESASTKGIKP